ncbi:NUDIX domain-containing protein [Patescibacteria group bacterium]
MKQVRASVIAMYDEFGRVLFQLRDDKDSIKHPGKWALIGGRLEDGESPNAGAIRELKEETGYQAKSMEKYKSLGVSTPQYDLVDVNIFLLEYDKEQQIHCFEGQEMKFLTKKEYLSRNIVKWQKPHVVEIFQRLSNGSKISLPGK